MYLEIEHTYIIIKIQIVPGRAGGGSFRREKELYSKERICL